MSPREAAAQALENILAYERFSNRETGLWLEKGWWSPEDQRLFLLLVYGSLEQLLQLDQLISRHARRSMDKLDPFLRGVLRISVYQLCYTDRIPAYAVINEAVNLAKKKRSKAAGLVNAVLRSIDRANGTDKRSISRVPDMDEQNLQDMSLAYSHPLWLVELLNKDFNGQTLKKLLSAHQQPPSLTLRLNLMKGEKEALLTVIRNEGIEVEPLEYLPEAYRVVKHLDLITRSKAYQQGLFHIQSLASMLAVHWLDPRPGELIIDVASAPGGKTTFIAQRMKGFGNVLARDISASRIRQIHQHAQRLGCEHIITCQVQDGRELDVDMIGKADRVLVDAPCSSLGMIRKKPELKYLKKEHELAALPELQYEMLVNASRLVRSGGILMYATCTYLDRENGGIVRRFLNQHPFFQLEVLPAIPTQSLLFSNGSTGAIQLGPHINLDFDGFYVARMKKIDSTIESIKEF